MTSAIGPGSVVVCVDASNLDLREGDHQIYEGHRYVVREIVEAYGQRGVTLRGVHNTRGIILTERAYKIERFRPIDDSDSQIFTDIIARTDEKAPA